MKFLVVGAVLLASLVACGPAANNGAVDHHCADKIAQGTVTTGSVFGLWNCLTPELQTSLKAAGDLANISDPDSVFSLGAATTYTFLGANEDFATYELVLNDSTTARVGVQKAVLTVWLKKGLVDNVGVAAAAF